MLFASGPAQGQTFPQWGDLKPGPYAVGFTVISKYDYSRAYKPKSDYAGKEAQSGERARPMQISIWYPGRPAAGAQPLHYSDYIDLIAAADSLRPLPETEANAAREKHLTRLVSAGAPPDKLELFVRARIAAFRDAAPEGGWFPLLVFGQGLYFEPTASNSILCEYVASHGYIVASTPLLGPASRRLPNDVVGLETAVRDLEFVIATMRDFPGADHNRLGLIGFDMGGMAAFSLVMRNTDVGALVMLDSGFSFAHNIVTLKQSPYFDLAKVRIPLLHITHQAPYIDASLYEALRYSDAYFLRLRGMRHIDFTSYAMIPVGNSSEWGPVAADPRSGYKVICGYVLNFLHAYLKGDAQGLAYMHKTPEQNGIAKEFVTFESKQGRKAPPTEEQFMALLEDDPGAAVQLFAEVKARDPEAVIFKESSVNAFGYALLQSARAKEAIDVLKLNVEAYPRSWNAYDSLGEAYMVAGDKELAIKSYNKSLELNPENKNAAEMLKRLAQK